MEPVLQSPGVATPEPMQWQLLKPRRPGACAPQQEKPLQGAAHAPQLERSPHSPQLEKSPCSNKGPAQPKISKEIKLLKKKEECAPAGTTITAHPHTHTHTYTHPYPSKTQNIHACINMISDKYQPTNPNLMLAALVNKEKAQRSARPHLIRLHGHSILLHFC